MLTRSFRHDTRLLAMLLLGTAGAPGAARAEGTNELTVIQKLDPVTSLWIDILDVGEEISWEGYSTDALGNEVHLDILLTDPAGAVLGPFPSGSVIPVLTVGTYGVAIQGVDTNFDLDADPDLVAVWDLSVSGTQPGYGRVFAERWFLSSINFAGIPFAETSEYNGSVFSLVNGGSPLHTGVVELDAEGLVGRVWQIAANETGVIGFEGRSILADNGTFLASQQIYLNPPEIATYTYIEPELLNAVFNPGNCAGVAPTLSTGEIEFESTVEGSLHFVCDINGDGNFDFTDDRDVHILVEATIGLNSVTWDGTFDTGEAVPPGDYTCQVILTVGEFHYGANDVESSYPGFRLFSLDQALDREGLFMYWNDSLVQSSDVLMPPPTNAFGLMNTGLDGVFSGDPGDTVIPNGNARSWGNFTAESKGDDGLLDTYTWLDDDRLVFPITVLDIDTDTDVDGIIDSIEDCLSLTDPLNPDSDGDGLLDGLEYYEIASDPNDPDSDGDSVLDGDEFPNANEEPGDDEEDYDGDGVLDINDDDDDDDGVLTLDEAPHGDTDGDGQLDYLDTDDDDDGALTIDEEGNGDTDGDGLDDYIDTDDDGDGLLTEDELSAGDFDGDGVDDARDADDDGDGLPTLEEGGADGAFDDDGDGDGDGNWHDPDSDDDTLLDGDEGTDDGDGDGDGNFVDLDSDDDTAPDETEGIGDSDADGLADFVDPDDDGDTVLTIDEAAGDTDGDLFDDRIDADDDGDGIPTATELADGDALTDGAVDGTDLDDDGLWNWVDLDSDGDGVDDETEGTVDTDADGRPDYLDDSLEVAAGWFQGGSGCNGAGAPASLGALAPLLLLTLRRKKKVL